VLDPAAAADLALFTLNEFRFAGAQDALEAYRRASRR
jgi:hypothetical protein